jgi:PAS domain S-box-containing protein
MQNLEHFMPETTSSSRANLPPASEDDDLLLGEQTAGVAYRFFLIVGVVSFILVLQGIFLLGWEPSQLGSVFICLIALYAAWQLRSGRVRRAITTFIWGMALIVLTLPFVVNGIRTPALTALPALCVLTGWLLGTRQLAVLVSLSAAAMMMYWIGELYGVITPGIHRPASTHLLILLATVLLAYFVTRAAIKSFQGQVLSVRESEERFTALFRANPLPCSTVEPTGATLEVNDAWVALFGIAAHEVQHRTATEMGVWRNEEHRVQVRAQLAASGSVRGFPTTLHTVLGERPFLLYIAPVEFGGSQRLVTTLVDQTDHLAAQATQRALTDQLEERVALRTAELSRTVQALQAAQEELVQSEKLASLGAMVAGISHELNTPIGNTLTTANTLKEVSKEFTAMADGGAMRKSNLAQYLSNVREMADLIERNARRAADLIASFKQVAVDRSSQRRREFNVADLVADVLITSKPLLRDRGVLFTQDIAEDLTCDTYPGPVEQILTNFVQNAVVHGFGGRDAGHIDIQVRKDGDSVVITVKDDGAGMSEHTLKHIFDPFFTTRLGQGGSGLGLSVSHHLAVAVLGGDLTAASQPGEGCTMTLRFLQRLPHSH